MKKFIITLFFLVFSGNAFGENAISIPYEEFKKLYGNYIRQDIMKEIEKDPFISSIDSAHYKISVTRQGGICEVTLAGTLISGSPESVPLFSDKIIIKKIMEVSGGSLLSTREEGISFLSSGARTFLIKLTFFIPAGEDNRSSYVALKIPTAVKNVLLPEAGKQVALFDIPGVKNNTGIYHFSPKALLKIRFSGIETADAKAAKRTKILSTRYNAVATPPLVLDAVNWFTSFEESGNVLSVIAMTVPSEAGESVRLKMMPKAKIWSCKVNGKKMKVYSDSHDGKTGFWILPLSKGKKSHIELALLSQGEKMGLHGKLELGLPEMELAARKINIAVGLPQRLEMISFQGPITPAKTFKYKRPHDFSGTPYYFSRSFHSGAPITMAVSYKEPVKK